MPPEVNQGQEGLPAEPVLSDEPILGIDFGELAEDERTAIEEALTEFLGSTLLVQNSIFQSIQATISTMSEKEF